MTDKQIWQLIEKLTLEEKAALCSGANTWTTKANHEKGIPKLRMADGPHGVRREDRQETYPDKANSAPATCFPTACAVAASWNPELAGRIGAAMADEARDQGIGMLLGPGVNIKRSPLGGRNFEYYSEDPVLAGEIAAGFINGMQNRGIAASIKHFAVNSQETKRMTVSSAIDDRALFDLYLKPFEIAIKKSRPATVMCSYNRVNGVYASENRRLLTEILRLRFGFDGVVVSDWGAVSDRPAGIAAGMDLEMPASGGAHDYDIVLAVREGRLSVDALDAACWNLLRLIFTYTRPAGHIPQLDYTAHHELAVEAAAQSAVLLKNDGLLPLAKGASVAVIGQMAEKPRYQGGGSSIVNAKKLVGFLAALDQAGQPYTYEPGYRADSSTTSALLEQAAQAAGKAETVLLFLGLPDSLESESFDREHLALPDSHLQLLEAVAAVNPNICVVLSCGSPVAVPWLPHTKALLCMYLAGEGCGEAPARLLFGETAPCGRLPESWPLALEDTPSYHNFPMAPNEATYNESLYVGYRYYDTVEKPVAFPFGYGLGYTRFAYSGLVIESDKPKEGDPLRFRFTLTNTGKRAGQEIPQVYFSRKTAAMWHPAHQLVSFGRVVLAPGESREMEFEIPYSDFTCYDPVTGKDLVEQGEYELQVGPHSRELPLKVNFTLEGKTLSPAPSFAADAYYGQIADNRFPEEEFARLYTGPRVSQAPAKKGEYTRTTPMDQMTGSFWGRRFLSIVTLISRVSIRFSTDKAANDHAGRAMAADLPPKNMIMQTEGLVTPAAVDALVDLCNGRGSLLRVIAGLFKRPYKRKKNNP